MDFSKVEAIKLTSEEVKNMIGNVNSQSYNMRLSRLSTAMAENNAYVGLGEKCLQLGMNKILIQIDKRNGGGIISQIYDVAVTLPSKYLPSVTTPQYTTKVDYATTNAYQYGEYEYIEKADYTDAFKNYVKNNINNNFVYNVDPNDNWAKKWTEKAVDNGDANSIFEVNTAMMNYYDNYSRTHSERQEYADVYNNTDMELNYYVKVNFDVTYKFSLEKITFNISNRYNRKISLSSFDVTELGSVITLTPTRTYDTSNPLPKSNIQIKPLFGESFSAYNLKSVEIEVEYHTPPEVDKSVKLAPTYTNNIPDRIYDALTATSKVSEDVRYTVDNITLKTTTVKTSSVAYNFYLQWDPAAAWIPNWADKYHVLYDNLPTFNKQDPICQEILTDIWGDSNVKNNLNSWTTYPSTFIEYTDVGGKVGDMKGAPFHWTYHTITITEETNNKFSDFETILSFNLTHDLSVAYHDDYIFGGSDIPDYKQSTNNTEDISGEVRTDYSEETTTKIIKAVVRNIEYVKKDLWSSGRVSTNSNHQGGRCVPTSMSIKNKVGYLEEKPIDRNERLNEYFINGYFLNSNNSSNSNNYAH